MWLEPHYAQSVRCAVLKPVNVAVVLRRRAVEFPITHAGVLTKGVRENVDHAVHPGGAVLEGGAETLQGRADAARGQRHHPPHAVDVTTVTIAVAMVLTILSLPPLLRLRPPLRRRLHLLLRPPHLPPPPTLPHPHPPQTNHQQLSLVERALRRGAICPHTFCSVAASTWQLTLLPAR
eukprot:scaffold9655_cov123-Isochrysis_galbana.AAC.4